MDQDEDLQGGYGMECQLLDQLNAVKPTMLALHDSGTSVDMQLNTTMNNDTDVEHPDNKAMMHGSVIFDVLNSMQFSHSQVANSTTLNPSANIYDSSNTNVHPHAIQSKLDFVSTSWNPNIYRTDSDTDVEHQNVGFDPIHFLRLPIINPDHAKFGLDDKHIPYNNNPREDQDFILSSNDLSKPKLYGNVNHNWVGSSLQLIEQTTTSPHNHTSTVIDDPTQYHATNDYDGASIKLRGTTGDRESYSSINGLQEYHDSIVDYSLQMFPLATSLDKGETMAQHDHDLQHSHYHEVHDKSSTFSGHNMISSKSSKRKRAVRGSCKNSEEREHQRMTHIAVERNRRRQMNEHLRVLRALMPPSYVQRGDQASIIGGAIEFVKELEQLLQCLESQKKRRMMANSTMNPTIAANKVVPLDTTLQMTNNNMILHQVNEMGVLNDGEIEIQMNNMMKGNVTIGMHEMILQHMMQCHEGRDMNSSIFDENEYNYMEMEGQHVEGDGNVVAQAKSSLVDIEVKMVDNTDVLIKILSLRRPRQLLYTITALEVDLNFFILHTNVTTIEDTVLYTFTVQISNANGELTAKKIATLVHEIFIQLLNQSLLKESM